MRVKRAGARSGAGGQGGGGQFFVTMTVTLPYTVAAFDAEKQDKYKIAVAATASDEVDGVVVTPEMVEIVSISGARRRAGRLPQPEEGGGSVVVETMVRV